MADLLFWLIVGGAAGWIAGLVVKGAGFGLIGNIVVGILGSIVTGFLFPRLGIAIGLGSSALSSTPQSGPSFSFLSCR
jgi:uncharacterized membrane protein YeaQ/YmgE (transglycosylase-associated protein family)